MTPPVLVVLVAKLQARGVTLRPDGETLRVRPVSKVTREELEELRHRKAEVMALLTRTSAARGITLHPETVREVLGADAADPHAVASVRFDVLEAVREIEAGIRAGVLPRRRLVRGRPLADWLSLEDVARLLRTGGCVR